ncbi:thymopoietin isoform X1 [Seriola lalandi dorsalis]|uniref:thymopoietin isoform X1 n=1 Tax=Seriola lalandi dorsalis TaxID=1841481 RepID=UPI000C6F8A39|nr:thymopoietin isoform X1 [Seriola lalandi dorsalis]XP_056224185.1 thymopoietin a isoform X1 [Seriola aureovittata]
MPEYLDDPSVLTKDKLKSELLAHNVELPSGNPNKDVYVQLYLKNLTAQNKKHVTATTLDAFSSDEELPPPVVSNRSRSSGRKATRKTDKVPPEELDVTMLTDEGLRDELLKHGVDAGPIVASTRKLYEKKLQKLLDNGPVQPPQLVLTEIQVNHNGKSESDLYSDKEDEVTPESEPVADPEPAPLVERPVRSRGKTPVTTRTRSSQHHTIHREELGLARPKHSKDSSDKPIALLNTALLEEPEPQRSARLSSPLVHLTRVEPLTFRPTCNISPIKRQESRWTVSDQVSAAGEEEFVPPDVQLVKQRQQKITSFLSTCSPVRTHSYTPTLSEGVLVRQVEKITASDQNLKVDESDVLKELFPNDINSPTGITATCRRPIRGAAGRPLKSSDLWNSENCLFSPKTTKTSSSSSSYTESCTVNRVTSLPPSTPSTSFTSSTSTSSFSNSSSRLLSAAPPAGPTKAERRGMSLWIKLFLLAIVAAFLFLVYQAMETNTINPFVGSDTDVASSSAA